MLVSGTPIKFSFMAKPLRVSVSNDDVIYIPRRYDNRYTSVNR